MWGVGGFGKGWLKGSRGCNQWQHTAKETPIVSPQAGRAGKWKGVGLEEVVRTLVSITLNTLSAVARSAFREDAIIEKVSSL